MNKPLKLLLVEDSDDDAQLVLRELQRGGYEVSWERVETPNAFKDALAGQSWDIILCDYFLPQFNAPQALEVLKASGQDLPFIIVSGTIGEETAVSALKAGAHDFLIKGNYARLGPAIERELRDAETRERHRRAEEALREKERLLSEAQQIGHIGSWSLDFATDALQYSDEMYRLLDVSPEEFQHNTNGLLGLIYSADRPEATQWMQSIKAGRQTRELDFRVFRTNGELRYIQCRGAIMFDSMGKPARFVGTAQDITERKLAEIQIRQQVAHLTALRTIDQAITSSFNMHVTLDVVLSQTIEQLQVDAADILLLEPAEGILEYYAAKGFRTQTIKSTRIRMGESHAGRAAKERRLVMIENLKDKIDTGLLATLLAGEDFVSYVSVPLITKGRVQGVLEIFHRVPLQPYPEWIDFLETLAGQAAIAIDNATLFENLQESNMELAQAYDATIEGWSHALDLRDKETEGHTLRVTEMTLKLAGMMGIRNEQLVQIRRGCLLHDIGKMGVPDGILLKPGKLTDDEWIVMRQHPQLAYEWLAPISFLRPALEIPYCHHEKWDGTGYPRGLKGDQIPLVARIFAVVDVWDALTSHRPYREAWSREKTTEYILEQSGKYFDPQIVEVFTKYISSTIEK